MIDHESSPFELIVKGSSQIPQTVWIVFSTVNICGYAIHRFLMVGGFKQSESCSLSFFAPNANFAVSTPI
jgi:hypothetical protein